MTPEKIRELIAEARFGKNRNTYEENLIQILADALEYTLARLESAEKVCNWTNKYIPREINNHLGWASIFEDLLQWRCIKGEKKV